MQNVQGRVANMIKIHQTSNADLFQPLLSVLWLNQKALYFKVLRSFVTTHYETLWWFYTYIYIICTLTAIWLDNDTIWIHPYFMTLLCSIHGIFDTVILSTLDATSTFQHPRSHRYCRSSETLGLCVPWRLSTRKAINGAPNSSFSSTLPQN